ncbi:MAG: helix-turn-helix transcriptional regulator, partial [Pseudonocardia sp.]|nr:helix-turn-helix transcriptional regulator [Pseudonocardia sp.]
GEGAAVLHAVRSAVVRTGSAPWCTAVERWWSLEHAVLAGDAATAAAIAADLGAPAPGNAPAEAFADAARAWAALLEGRVDATAVLRAAGRLAGSGRRWEAAALCGAAARRSPDPAAGRELLGTGRRLGADRATRGRSTGRRLSERERDIGALVVDGLTHKEIGSRLYLSPKTVEQHVSRLRQKLAAANRAALVAALREEFGT